MFVQPLKAVRLMPFNTGNTISVRPVQPLKALSPICEMLEDMVMLSSAEQLLNAISPIVARLCGKPAVPKYEIPTSDVQPLNALSPIDFRFSFSLNTTDSRLSQPQNALVFSSVTFAGIVTSVRAVQP